MACSSLVRIATLRSPEDVVRKNEDGTLNFLGVQGKLLGVIIQGLNVQFELVEVKKKAWGQLLPDGNWTGMIGMMQKGYVDMVDNFMVVTEQRSSVVDYTPTVTTEVLTFAIGKPGFRPKSMALVNAFDSTIWITTLIILLLMPLAFTTLLREKGGYLKFMLKLASYLVQKSFDHKQDQFKYRILLSSWIIFATILSFSYTAVFFSLFTLPVEIKGVQNFQELSDAVLKKGYKCYIRGKSSTVDFLLQSEEKYLRELVQKIVSNEWYLKYVPLPLNTQMDKQSAMIGGREFWSLVAGPEDWKHFYMSDDSLLSIQMAVVMNKDFCHKRRLINVIHRVNNGGLYQKILNHENFKLWLSAPDRRRTVARSVGCLSLSDLSGAFLLLAAGLGFSTICFLTELLFSKKA